MTGLITLSASYGAGGSRIGPALAERLQVPFVDRLIPLGVAERLDVNLEDAVAHDMKLSSFFERVLRSFVAADTTGAPAPLVDDTLSTDEFRRATEEVIVSQAASGSGVILGRAGAIVLRDDPRVLRVRLDGPAERRIHQAVMLQGLDDATARRAQPKADRAHANYVKHFYNLDIHDPLLYHLVIDSTAITIGGCVEMIAVAAGSVSVSHREPSPDKDDR
jgi:cytidylate kinase